MPFWSTLKRLHPTLIILVLFSPSQRYLWAHHVILTIFEKSNHTSISFHDFELDFHPATLLWILQTQGGDPAGTYKNPAKTVYDHYIVFISFSFLTRIFCCNLNWRCKSWSYIRAEYQMYWFKFRSMPSTCRGNATVLCPILDETENICNFIHLDSALISTAYHFDMKAT